VKRSRSPLRPGSPRPGGFLRPGPLLRRFVLIAIGSAVLAAVGAAALFVRVPEGSVAAIGGTLREPGWRLRRPFARVPFIPLAGRLDGVDLDRQTEEGASVRIRLSFAYELTAGRLAEAAARALETGCAACQVPEAECILRKWMETIDDLEARRPHLSRRLDWRAKLDVLQRARELATTDRQRLRMVDLHYAELGGLFEKMEQIGAVDRLEDFLPAKSLTARRPRIVTRERVRALLVGRFGRHLDRVDWDYAVGRDEAGRRWLIRLDDPLDSRELLKVVTDAKDWDSCVEGLIRTASAQAVANISAAVCDGRPERPGIIVLT